MEEKDLSQWLSNREQVGSEEPILDQAIDIIEGWDIKPVDEDKLWQKINADIKPKINRPEPKKRNLWILSGVAASLLLITAIFFLKSDNLHTISSERTLISHSLPDNSQVDINRNTTLVYDETFEDRSVKLSGEAYFKVEKGSQFDVVTDNGTITVLGTEFNVFARKRHLSVICTEGKVQVTAGNENTLLLPGQQALLKDGILNVSEIDPTYATSWTRGESKFRDTPLGHVLSSIASYYELTLDISEEVNLHENFTGSYTHENLVLGIEMIIVPMKLKYELKNNTLRVTE